MAEATVADAEDKMARVLEREEEDRVRLVRVRARVRVRVRVRSGRRRTGYA